MNLLLVANWKMNKTPKEALAFAEEVLSALQKRGAVKVILCPPFVALPVLHDAFPKISLGAQNIYIHERGPYTGEVSAPMVAPYASTVILGHSERRRLFGETDELINLKLKSALVNGLDVILCIGETLADKEEGKTRTVIESQLDICMADLQPDDFAHITVAYEPIWAISTTPGASGETDDPETAQVMHKLIKRKLTAMPGFEGCLPVIYGGSVKPDNAEDILSQPDIDGALVGGASLNPDDFCALIETAKDAS